MKKENKDNQRDKYRHKKYAKKYRRRHYVGLVIFGVLTCASLFFLGASFSKSTFVVNDNTPQITPEERTQAVTSTAGFSFDIPKNKYQVFATTSLSDPLLAITPPYSGDFNKTQLKIKPSPINSDATFAKFTVEKRPKKDYDIALIKKKTNDEAIKELADFSASGFTVKLVKSEPTTLNNQAFQLLQYELTPSQPGANKIYTQKWVKVTDEGVYIVSAEDLTAISEAKSVFSLPLRTIQIGAQNKLEKLSSPIFSNLLGKNKTKEVTSDEVSPSVVKIYHFVCGNLVLNGQELTNDTCDGNVGSGFFISGDGIIATNGHVVTLTPADFLINIVSSSPESTRQLLQFMGVPSESISGTNQNQLAASLMSKLYNLPPERLRIDNYRELTVVAMGSEPLKFTSVEDVKKLMKFNDSERLAKAELLARNYSAKDIASLNQQNSSGFSASDVALLKVNVAHTPYIELANTDQTDVNSKIIVVGFPSDAENQLTENDYISPTVTAGTISAKRSANGSTGRLFQSDVDASQGNSGGPAINQSGQALGLLTYRYKDETSSNAAKSYIRDINDLIDLAKSNNITLGGDNTVYESWLNGLTKYRASHYTASLRDFATVQQLFPAHRLVSDYALKANQAIREGKDKPVINYTVVLLALSAIMGTTGVVVVAIAIHRHRLGHHIHKTLKTEGAN
ncbi:hypothetical protein A3F37_03600 [Candidatus Saccharibacteria bacterium RIFCSPHIGHO2_12_FULL_41_12]|nr:MAG: hypothetical protein A3F37_03600 [Candidatus Saccharibacteria bacterium RIFCSPHIGHO2_12_FULL_41_12]